MVLRLDRVGASVIWAGERFWPEHRERLSRAILNVVDNLDCREFRRYCQLASRVDTHELIPELQARKAGADEDVARRATWVLEAIEAAELTKDRRC